MSELKVFTRYLLPNKYVFCDSIAEGCKIGSTDFRDFPDARVEADSGQLPVFF